MNSPHPMISIPETKAREVLEAQDEFGLPVMEYTKVDDYTTFRAEYGFDADDIVFHFFLPKELEGKNIGEVRKYWMEHFPAAMERVAMSHFDAGYPRLKAAHTSELDSWWLRANKFGNVGDPVSRCEKFFELLDQALDALKVSIR